MTMDTIDYARRPFDVRSLAERFAPGRIRLDPAGLVSGYKAYQIYTALAAKSDGELAGLGLRRSALPAIAMRAATEARAD